MKYKQKDQRTDGQKNKKPERTEMKKHTERNIKH
jgi:hypothetical protein